MAKIDVIMPQMGESIAEGTLSRWMKKVGDAVKRDEPIFEISTDKVDAEIPAPAAGVLTEILVTEGQTVAVQTVVATIETEAAAGAAAPAASPAPPAKTPAPAAPAPTAPPPAPRPSAPSRPAPEPAPVARSSAEVGVTARAGSEVGGNGSETAEERLRRKSTPLVRKMAAEHNLDLSAIPGSGLAGRVTKNDILSYLETGAAPDAPAARRRTPRARRPAPAAPAAAPAVRPARRGLAGRPGRALVPDPEAHGRAHGDVAPGLAAREHDLRDRLHPGGPASRAEEEGVRRPRREPDLSRVHRQGGGGRRSGSTRRSTRP